MIWFPFLSICNQNLKIPLPFNAKKPSNIEEPCIFKLFFFHSILREKRKGTGFEESVHSLNHCRPRLKMQTNTRVNPSGNDGPPYGRGEVKIAGFERLTSECLVLHWVGCVWVDFPLGSSNPPSFNDFPKGIRIQRYCTFYPKVLHIHCQYLCVGSGWEGSEHNDGHVDKQRRKSIVKCSRGFLLRHQLESPICSDCRHSHVWSAQRPHTSNWAGTGL